MLRIGLVLSAGFVVAAVASFALGTAAGRWAGLHLALAGAALVAVGTFMPHFRITLAGTAPARPELGVLGIAALAIGALLAVGGVLMAAPVSVLAAAASLWLGLALTAWVTFRPARQPLARRHPIAQLAYATALVEVALGIGLATAHLAGYDPAAWSRLKPAHVWLNLFGFVSLTITATLVYLFPTIAGARIRFHPSLPVMVGGAMAGPPLVAAGAIAGLDPVASSGAIVTLAGAGGQLVYLIDVHRRGGGWTTDPGWHRVANSICLLEPAGTWRPWPRRPSCDGLCRGPLPVPQSARRTTPGRCGELPVDVRSRFPTEV